MDEGTRSKREAGWLEVLYIYFQRELLDKHLFRTAVDNWAMYRKGGFFLTSNGNPKFFNKPRSDDKRLLEMDFQSEAAWSIMNGVRTEGMLIVDHAVPVSVLHSVIHQSKPSSPKDIEQILLRNYRLGVLTYEEDGRLTKSIMPEGWCPGADSPFARYERAGIIGRVS